MRIDISIEINAPGLVGGDKERASHLGTWASFGRYRRAVRVPLVADPSNENHLTPAPGAVLTYHFYLKAAKLRGDESIWFRLYSNTRFSGVTEMDKVDHDYVERNIYSGDVQLPLCELLEAVDVRTGEGKLDAKPMLDNRLVAHLCMLARMQQQEPNQAEIIKECIKGELRATIRVTDVTSEKLRAVRAFHDSLRTARGITDSLPVRSPATGAILYVPENFAHFTESLNRFISVYCERYIGRLDANTGNITGPPRYEASTPGIKGLQFAVYRTAGGQSPMIAFWAHQAFARHWATQEEREEALRLYGSNAMTENFYETSTRAACRRYGIEPENVVAAVDAQYASTGARVLPEFVLSKCVAVDVGTFMANSLNYTADMRYTNARSYAGKKGEQKSMELESFDLDGSMLQSNAHDCEDMGGVATATSRVVAFARGDIQLNTWKSPLLRAVQRMLNDSAFLDVGGDVTARYLKADGSEAKKGEIKDLPMKDSTEDQRNTTGGHAFGLVVSLARLFVWHMRGAAKGSTAFTKRVTGMAPWQFRVPTLVLEGTGAVDHLILPAAEIFGEDSPETHKSVTARAFVRDVLATDDYKVFGETFRSYSVPFYSHKVDARRRISGFYRSVVHATCCETYAMDHGLSQFSFVDPVKMTRGIDVAVLLRDSLNDPSDLSAGIVGIDFPFQAMTKEWDTLMVPVMESQVNQMPVTALESVAALRIVRPFFFGVMTGPTLGDHLRATKESGALSASLANRVARESGARIPLNSPSGTFAVCAACEPTHTKRNSGKQAEKASLEKLRNAGAWTVVPARAALDACTGCGRFQHAGNVEAALRQQSASTPMNSPWMTVLDRSPIAAGTLDWERVNAAAVSLSIATPAPVLDAEHSMAPYDAIPVSAAIAVYSTEAPLSKERTAEIMSCNETLGWGLLTKGGEKWERCPPEWSGYRVSGARLLQTLPDSTVRLQIDIRAQMGDFSSVSSARRLSLVHVSVMGRVFALHPIVLTAGSTGFLTHALAEDAPDSRKLPRVSISNDTVPIRPAMMSIQVVIHGATEFAQAFCTIETLEARPWIFAPENVVSVSATTGRRPLHMDSLPPLEYYTGRENERSTLDVFRNCYKRDDVVLVRFVARDWHVRKSWNEVTQTIDMLYKKGLIVGHEFAVATPLPQCDDIVELHILLRVGSIAGV